MSGKMEELLDVYDVNGRFQNRTIVRGEPISAGDYVRIIQVWVRNSAGDYLIQKRSKHVKVWPDIWATTAGAVSAGETSRTGAIRELAEEMGVCAAPEALIEVGEGLRKSTIGTVWLLEQDVDETAIQIQEEEVSAVMWASAETIREMVAAGTFYDYGSDYFEKVFSHTGMGD